MYEEIAQAIGKAIGPIVGNAVATIVKGLKGIVADDVVAKLSKKEIVITIKLPDLTDNA